MPQNAEQKNKVKYSKYISVALFLLIIPVVMIIPNLDTTSFTDAASLRRSSPLDKLTSTLLNTKINRKSQSIPDPVAKNNKITSSASSTLGIKFQNLSDGDTVGGKVNIEVKFENLTSFSYYNLAIDGKLLSSPWVPWDTTKYSDGDHIVKATVADGEGRIATATITVKVNNSDPTLGYPRITLYSPLEGTTVSGKILISFKMDGGPYGISFGGIDIDGKKQFDNNWDTTKYSNGNHTFKITVSTLNPVKELVKTTTVNISNTVPVVDITPPAVNITNPSSGSSVSGNVNITATATDDSAISYLNIYVNNVVTASCKNKNNCESTWNTKDYANKSYTIQAEASDIYNNIKKIGIDVNVNNIPADTTPPAEPTAPGIPPIGTTNPPSTTAIVPPTTEPPLTDTTKPTVRLVVPFNNTEYYNYVTVMANASDDFGIKQVEFKVTGTNISKVLTKAPYQEVLDLTSLPNNSTQTIEVVAIDTSGNKSDISKATFKYLNTINPVLGVSDNFFKRIIRNLFGPLY